MGQQPQVWPYLVTGIFHTGLDELDAALAFVSLEAAQRDLGWRDQISGIQIRLVAPFEARLVAPALGVGVDYDIVTWMDTHRNLYASIRLEKRFGFLVLCLIVMVAGFNIASISTMTVADRQRDIGILKSPGRDPGRDWQGVHPRRLGHWPDRGRFWQCDRLCPVLVATDV